MAPDDQPGPAELTRRAAGHGLLRPALELAVAVARAGVESRPPVPPPPAFRPILRHAKWTARTAGIVGGVVDGDEQFRRRVTDAAGRLDDGALGRPAELWLRRPQGWEDELTEVLDDLDQAERLAQSDKEERAARHRVAGLTAELEERRVLADRAEQRAARAEAELLDQRRQRREAEIRLEGLQRDLEGALEAGRSLRRELDAREQVVAASLAGLEHSEAAIERLQADGIEYRRQHQAVVHRMAEREAELKAVVDARRTVELANAEMARAMSDASEAAQALSTRLARAAGRLDASTDGTPRTEDAGRASSPAVIGAHSPAVSGSPRQPGSFGTAPARRHPVPLPPAVFEDSPEAASHLVRAGVLLIVDGYNVSLFAWPDLDLARQRERLTGALSELAARSGAVVQLIFDGHESHSLPPVPGMARASVRVVFSPPGVEADEVIIKMVDDHPLRRPVVVATNDRRIQEEVRARGANVLTTPQVLGLLRRGGQGSPGWGVDLG